MSIASVLFATASATAVLTAFATPSSIYGSHFGPGVAATPAVTISVTGGTTPYTYAWTKVSGDTMTVANPTGASTGFSATVGYGDSLNATYRCTITDAAGRTKTVDVGVTLEEQSFA